MQIFALLCPAASLSSSIIPRPTARRLSTSGGDEGPSGRQDEPGRRGGEPAGRTGEAGEKATEVVGSDGARFADEILFVGISLGPF